MKIAIYLYVLLICFLPIEIHAQLAIIDTINFRPAYLEDSIQLVGKRNDHFIDAQGNFWIGFSDLGARKLTDTLWTEYTTANSGIASNHVLDVSQSANNDMWFGTNNGVSVFDGTNWTNYNRANSGIVSDTVTVIENHNNTHWIGTRNGLSKFDGTTFTNYNTSNSGLLADSIISLAIDQAGNVWVGTQSGIGYFDGIQWTLYNTWNIIYDIEIDGDGVVWIAPGTPGPYFLKNGTFVNYFQHLNSYSCESVILYYGVWYLTRNNSNTVCFTSGNLTNSTLGLNVATAVDSELIYAPYSSPIAPYLNKPLLSRDLFYIVDEPYSNNPFSSYDSYPVYSFAAPGFNHESFKKPYQQYSYGIFSNPMYNNDAADLNVNQINTRILNRGDMHWDPITQVNYYEVPVCENKSTVFASALWLGGLDQSGLLHTAAQTYRQQGAMDFYTGPLDTTNAQSDSVTKTNYDKLWKVDQWIINQFRLNFLEGNVANGSYKIPDVILKWPAHGSGNFSRNLAPFIDYNNDGVYNAMDGDYPKIDGDQMIWWVFNDQGIHTETNGTPFGFEIHGKAYGYGCPDLTGIDTVFNYTTFYQWKIINRSSETYHDVYAGLWCDFDLGNATDDYVGCDVGNATFFAYNSDADDDISAGGYGTNPPVQNITVLKGPLANPNDGIDNNHNGLMDEQDETINLSSFLYYGQGQWDDPNVTDDYYQYLTSTWLDGLPVTFGGSGRGGTDPCNYMFPGTTDPAFPGQDWTMPLAGLNGNDMRGVGSSGPFTIAPGETQTIDFAYITTRDANTQISLTTNQLYTSYIRNWFKNGAVHPCPHDSFTFVPPITDTIITFIYPNPSIDYVLIGIPQDSTPQQILVYDMQGRLCISKTREGNNLDIRNLSGGIYILKLVTDEMNYIARFVKVER